MWLFWACDSLRAQQPSIEEGQTGKHELHEGHGNQQPRRVAAVDRAGGRHIILVKPLFEGEMEKHT